jgi:hypothetical protein
MMADSFALSRGVAAGMAQQKDDLCGPFHAARVLRDAGVNDWCGDVVDQDLVARHAGTVLPAAGRDSADRSHVPPGASSRRDYRFELPRVEEGRSGTPVSALAQAIEAVSARRLRCLPLRGSWAAESVERLVDAGHAGRARLIANLRTGRLWGTRPAPAALLAELEGRPVADAQAPSPDWDVGHFVELACLVRGPAGSLVLVRDSYPTLGWMGHHLQPPRAVAAALMRGDGRQGGVLAVVAPADESTIRNLAAELALAVEMWDNGTRS